MEKVLQRKIRFGYAIIKLQPLYRQKEADTNTTAKVWQGKKTHAHIKTSILAFQRLRTSRKREYTASEDNSQ